MNNYCKKIQLPFDVELKNFPPTQYEDRVYMIRPAWSTIDKKLLSFLSSKKLHIKFYEVFYTPPQHDLHIHVDSNEYSNMTKLNFCLSSIDSVMNWFEPKTEFKNKSSSQTMLKTNYLKFKPEEVDLLHTQCIAGWYLVNAGIPHNATNFTDEQRWTLSYTLLDLSVNPPVHLEFDKAAEIFKDYIL